MGVAWRYTAPMATPSPGDSFLDRYEILSVVAAHEHWLELLAHDGMTGRRVTLKFSTSPDEVARTRFAREIQAVARLRDPHTLAMHDTGKTSDGERYMVYEHVDGETLGELIRRLGRLDEATTLHVVRQLLSSLREAHAHGLLHRNLNPADVRVFGYRDDPFCVKLANFGLAFDMMTDAPRLTREGFVGNARYVAPEVVTRGEFGPASDLYAVGLLAFEMVTGAPAVGDRQGEHEIVRAHVEGTVARFGPSGGPSPPTRELVRRLTAASPADRFRSADEVLRAIDTGRSSVPAPSLPASSGATPSPAKGWLLPALFLAVVGIVGGGVFVAWSGSPPAPSEPSAPLPPHPAAAVSPPAEVIRDALPSPPTQRATVDPSPAMAGVTAAFELALEGTAACRPDAWVDRDVQLLPSGDEFAIKLPDDYDPGIPHPVVFFFHDLHHAGRKFVYSTRMMDLNETEEFVVVHIRRKHPPLHAEMNRNAWRPVPEATRSVLQVMERVRAQVCVDPDRMFGVGHGIGAIFLDETSCDLGLAGVVASGTVRGVPDRRCEDGRAVPFLLFWGRSDNSLPREGAERTCLQTSTPPLDSKLAAGRELYGCHDEGWTPSERGDGYECSQGAGCDAPLVLCEHDFGHEWPGGELRGLASLLNPACLGPAMGFDAAGVAWRFFDGLPPLDEQRRRVAE